MIAVDKYCPSYWLYKDREEFWSKRQIEDYEYYLTDIYKNLYNEKYTILIAEEITEETTDGNDSITYRYGVFINE